MRSVTFLRKAIYPAILVLLSLTIAGGPAGQALASAPVANYIGADAYHNPTWAQANTSGSKSYIGPLASEKFFYNNKPLPGSDTATTYQFNTPGCGTFRANVLCIIVWNYAGSTDGSDLHSFLESTLRHPNQHILMAYCNEPEYHDGAKGCVCDPPGAVKPTACGSAEAIVAQFEVESKYITAFEKAHSMSNVKVAEISGTRHYGAHSSCDFIVHPQYVSYYLADVYRPGLASAQSLKNDVGWNRWVTCTKFPGKARVRGISEYGIDCAPKTITREKEDSARAGTYAADDA